MVFGKKRLEKPLEDSHTVKVSPDSQQANFKIFLESQDLSTFLIINPLLFV